VISPITESKRNGMLSLTTVITVTGRPWRTNLASSSMAMTLPPLRCRLGQRLGRELRRLFELAGLIGGDVLAGAFSRR
jgi:hypothetical protein